MLIQLNIWFQGPWTHLVHNSNEEDGKQEIATNDDDANEQKQFQHE